jgi:hypothetical protein
MVVSAYLGENRRHLCSKAMNTRCENAVFWRLKMLVPRIMIVDRCAVPPKICK